MQPPREWYEPMILPLIASFFGVLVFFLGSLREQQGKKALWKWAGVLLSGFGLYAVMPYFMLFVGNSVDAQFYQSAAIGRRMAMGHWIGFLVPVLAILGCVIAHVVLSRSQRAGAAAQ